MFRQALVHQNAPVLQFLVYQLNDAGGHGLRRKGSAFLLTLPAREPSISFSHWLRDAIRSSILSGNLQPKQRVPSSRELAAQYSLSRGTVLAALEELKAEGYLSTIRGSGVYVSTVLPDSLMQRKISTSRRATLSLVI